ncbi:MAG: ATP-binding cassette domain-containing protein, partial [Caldisericaceae bacterium]|nr:ATP-binding cassette domain-containing protein [Caldisericaceae bacterium]
MTKVYKIRIATHKFPLVQIDQFVIKERRITFLFGESGIGKTLIAQTIFGLVTPGSLSIAINGQSYYRYLKSSKLKELQRSGFFVFQEPSTHLNPLMTVEEQLNEGSLVKQPDNRKLLESLWAAPFETQIKPLLKVYPKPYRPSGGEKQRFLLAMALKKMDLLGNQAGLFIFDEPTGSLDNYFRNIFIDELFKRYRQHEQTILFITHDYSIISEIENHHHDLMPQIHLTELRRTNHFQVKLFPFKAKDYLKWLKKQKPVTYRKTQKKSVVLKVKSDFAVFGKRFSFTKGRSGKTTDLVVEQGKLTYLKAPSGLGKTTLAKIICGLQKSDNIRFELAGLTFTEKTPNKIWQKEVWGKKRSMVFQHADEALDLNASVMQVFKGLPVQPALSE